MLSACTNSSDDGGSAVSNQGGENDEAGKKVRIAFSAPAADHGWMSAITKSAVAQAKTHDDVELINAEGTNDVNLQISQVETFINDKVDAIVLLPFDGAAMTSVARKAMDAGIPVVNVDREFNSQFAARTTVLGDNYGMGVSAGTGVRFAHEVHPSEIAYDYWTTHAALEAIGHREAFGLNWDPSYFVWQDLDPIGFLWDFRDRIYHVDCKDTKKQLGNGRNGRLGSHLPWADPRRGWDFVSTGRGDVPWEASFRMLNTIGYDGPISVEWEDAGMDRLLGAPEALAFVKANLFDAPEGAFDAAFSSGD